MKPVEITLLLALVGSVSACLPSNPATEMYVCTDAKKSKVFTQQLAAILRGLSFTPKLGRTDGERETIYVLEANKMLVRIWAQNQPLDPPLEVAGRNEYLGPVVDPNQYIVSVQSWEPRLESPKPLFERLRARLTGAGFRVHREPGQCVK